MQSNIFVARNLSTENVKENLKNEKMEVFLVANPYW